MKGTRESNPCVHDLQHPRLGKPRRGLQIMDTRMGFPCPFHGVVIDSISLAMLRIQFSLEVVDELNDYLHLGHSYGIILKFELSH